jgi:hypothetical protein
LSATFAPYGFIPVRLATGGIPGRAHAFRGAIASGYAHDIAKGDPIKFVTAGTIQFAAAGDPVDGVFDMVQYRSAGKNNNSPYWPSGTVATDVIAWIHIDPSNVYKVQANASIAQTAIGDCADLIAGTTNASSFGSQSYLDSLVGVGNSAQFRIFGVFEQGGNDWGDAKTQVLVTINERGGFGAVTGNAI